MTYVYPPGSVSPPVNAVAPRAACIMAGRCRVLIITPKLQDVSRTVQCHELQTEWIRCDRLGLWLRASGCHVHLVEREEKAVIIEYVSIDRTEGESKEPDIHRQKAEKEKSTSSREIEPFKYRCHVKERKVFVHSLRRHMKRYKTREIQVLMVRLLG